MRYNSNSDYSSSCDSTRGTSHDSSSICIYIYIYMIEIVYNSSCVVLF